MNFLIAKAPPMWKTLLGFLLISCLSLASTEHNITDGPTAYEMLEWYNLPKGILPEGVQSYLLRPDGSFQVFFASDCEFMLQRTYLVRYKRTISGTVDVGTLKDLNGVSVKMLIVWIGVTKVIVEGDELRLYVGPFSVSFPTSSFDESPKCRSGFGRASALVSDS